MQSEQVIWKVLKKCPKQTECLGIFEIQESNYRNLMTNRLQQNKIIFIFIENNELIKRTNLLTLVNDY